MITITVEMIRSWEPCYDPTTIDGVGEDWTGTAIDVLNSSISTNDKFWLILRCEILDEKILRQFSRWCALQVVHLWNAPQIVIDYLNSGDESLRAAARDAARAAAWDAAGDAAGDAARYAAWYAAWDAAGDAAGDAAWAAARYAAWDAARYAAWDAARAAAGDAAGDAAWAAAWDAAGDAAGDAQLLHLIFLIEENEMVPA